MSASLKNSESLEQINLARWSIQNTKPDFHLMGHIAAKLKNKPVLVGFFQTHASTVFSLILISTSRNCKHALTLFFEMIFDCFAPKLERRLYFVR